jgi:hypothetical protein
MKFSKATQNSNYRGSDEPPLRHGKRIPVAMSPNIVRREFASDTLFKAALRGDLHRGLENPYKAALTGSLHRGVEIPQKTAFQGSLHLGPTSPHQGYTGGDPGASPYIPLRKGHTTDPYPVEAFAAPIGAHQRTTSDSPIRNHSEHSRATPVSSIPPVALARSKRPAGKIKP